MMWPGGCAPTGSPWILQRRGCLVYIQSVPPSATCVTNPSGLSHPVSVVRNIGIYMDADASVRSHLTKTVTACLAILRHLWSIHRSVPSSVIRSLVSSLVLQWMDYSNAMLAGMASNLIKRMQSVMNSATRLVFSASRYDRTWHSCSGWRCRNTSSFS